MSKKSLKALVFVLGVSLVGCGAPPDETEPQQPPAEAQPAAPTESEVGTVTAFAAPVSSLTYSRNLSSGDTYVYNTVSGGVAPYTYVWRSTETDSWSTRVGAWQVGGATSPKYYCPRLPIHDGVYVWTLKVEAYVVDASGAASAIVSLSFNCRD